MLSFPRVLPLALSSFRKEPELDHERSETLSLSVVQRGPRAGISFSRRPAAPTAAANAAAANAAAANAAPRRPRRGFVIAQHGSNAGAPDAPGPLAPSVPGSEGGVISMDDFLRHTKLERYFDDLAEYGLTEAALMFDEKLVRGRQDPSARATAKRWNNGMPDSVCVCPRAAKRCRDAVWWHA